MPERDKKPKQTENDHIFKFSEHVKPGEYVLFGSSDVPDGIPTGGSDCRGIVLAASTMGSTSLPNVPPSIAPNGDVYLLRYFRNYPNSTTQRKVDDVLYWPDIEGYTWTIHSKDSPDHHSDIMSSTDLAGLIDDMDLPSASRGTLDEYRSAGGYLEFEKPFKDKDSSE